MGISADNARLLVDCRQRGVVFGRTLMIGRQNVYLSQAEFRLVLATMGLAGDRALAGAVGESGDFAEPLFRALGAQGVDSLDASEFEGASLVHDLNLPVPAEWHERFDFVYDGGTLEHVFDFPAAIVNCMRMTKVGGHLVLHTPANNALGHGFYQFSPEVFFRVLSEENGFVMQRMLAIEAGLRSRWHEVVDPNEARARGQVANRVPVLLHVEARKVASTAGRLRGVQQSDYQTRWTTHAATGAAVPHLADMHHRMDARLRRWLLRSLPRVSRMIERAVGIYLTRAHTFRNPANYRATRPPVGETAGSRSRTTQD